MTAIGPKSILIVGGGTAGWMAANLLLHYWPNTQVSLVESHDVGIIGVGEGSTPYLKSFFSTLGIRDDEWMPKCNATYKAGIRFPNWSEVKDYESYFHPFYSQLDIKTGDEFFRQCKLKQSGRANAVHPDDYFVAEKISSLGLAPVPSSPLPFDVDYGYHFDSSLLGAYLRERAQGLGLKHIIANVQSVSTDTDGCISSVDADGEILRADFFIDCSGFAGVLIEKALGASFLSYEDALLNDAAVTIATPRDHDALLFSETTSTALAHGWVWRIPLTARVGNGYVYSRKFISQAQAEAELREHLGVGDEVPCRHLAMRVGRREQHWLKNCVAVGLSQGFIEPLEATALMLTQYTIERFIQRYCDKSEEMQAAQNAFNQDINGMMEGVKDYVQCHYLLNSKSSSDYWVAARNTQPSDRLAAILNAWQEHRLDDQLQLLHGQLAYLRPSWYVMLCGMGCFNEKAAECGSDDATRLEAGRHCENIARATFQNHAPLLKKYADNS